MKPLQEIANPPIDKEQVKILFGPIQDLMAHHELFYTALTQRTMDWGPKQTVGNVFMTVSILYILTLAISLYIGVIIAYVIINLTGLLNIPLFNI